MECNKVKDLLSMYIDDLLEKAEKEELKAHLENCLHCQKELASLQDTLKLIEGMEEIYPPEGFRKEIINKLQGTKPESINTSINSISSIKGVLTRFNSSKIVRVSSIAAGLLIIAGIAYYNINIYGQPIHSVQSINDQSISREMYDGVAKAPMVEAGNLGENERTYGPNDAGKLGRIPKNNPVVGHSSSNYDRKVIKNGSMVLETMDFDKTISSIDRILEKFDGYYENKSINSQGETKSGNITLRIPAPQFLETTAQIERLGKVISTSNTGNDVTTEYYDTKARIKVLNVQEERLLAILKKAKDVNEILSVENELSRIREEIEINQGRMKVLDNNIGMSTLNLEITEVKEITHITPPGIKGTILRSWQAFIKSVNGIIKLIENLVIFLGGALPFLAIITLASLGYIYYKKRKAKQKAE